MVVQLSAWISIRNNGLRNFIENSERELQNWKRRESEKEKNPWIPKYKSARRGSPSESEIKRLKEIIEEVDELHSISDSYHESKPIVGPNVVIVGGFSKILERSKDKNKSKGLYEDIHKILKNYFIDPDIYRRFGEAFEELDIKPDKDFKEAIEFGTELRHRRHEIPRTPDRFCWRVELERREHLSKPDYWNHGIYYHYRKWTNTYKAKFCFNFMFKYNFLKENRIITDSSIRPLIFGINDGLVSTIALIAGLNGAFLSKTIIIIASFAEMFAGSISMALGEYISSKSQIEYYKGEILKERQRLIKCPEVEKKDLEEIYKRKGFSGNDLKTIVKVITSNKQRWLDVLTQEELGLIKKRFDNPKEVGLMMFFSYILGCLIPLLPYFFISNSIAFLVSACFSGFFIFFVGALKSFVTKKDWLTSGLEMLFIAVFASLAAYYIGNYIGNFSASWIK